MSGVATVGKSLQLLFLISSSIIIINCLSSSCSQEGIDHGYTCGLRWRRVEERVEGRKKKKTT
jgi:hypothetical protein